MHQVPARIPRVAAMTALAAAAFTATVATATAASANGVADPATATSRTSATRTDVGAAVVFETLTSLNLNRNLASNLSGRAVGIAPQPASTLQRWERKVVLNVPGAPGGFGAPYQLKNRRATAGQGTGTLNGSWSTRILSSRAWSTRFTTVVVSCWSRMHLASVNVDVTT
jgi:hypothetical protein